MPLPSLTLDLSELIGGEDSPRDEIINRAAYLLLEDCRCELKQEILKSVNDAIRSEVTSEVATMMAKPIHETDPYGSRRNSEPMTLAELIVKFAKEHLREKVDERGQPNQYNGRDTRLVYVARQIAAEAVAKDLKDEIAAARKEVTDAIKGKLAQVFAESVTECLTPKK